MICILQKVIQIFQSFKNSYLIDLFHPPGREFPPEYPLDDDPESHPFSPPHRPTPIPTPIATIINTITIKLKMFDERLILQYYE